MKTYILMAPDYSKVDNLSSDYRFYHAESLDRALARAADTWQCDPEDICVLFVFDGKCQHHHPAAAQPEARR